MKKLQISVLSLLFVSGLFSKIAVAQEGSTKNTATQKDGGLYVDVGFGYNFSLNSDNIGVNTTYIRNQNTTTEITELVNGSFGKGMNFGANIGYMFNTNIGAELGINYLMGGSYKLTDNQTTTNWSSVRNQSISASMIQFNPSIVLTTGAKGLAPYAKFGVVIGSGSINTETKDIYTSGSVVTTREFKFKANGGVALGWSAALGAKFVLNDKMSLFGELNMINMSYAPNKGENTKWAFDGVDQLATLTTYQKEVKYVSETTYTLFQDPNEPREILKSNYSFSSLGLKIGLHIAF